MKNGIYLDKTKDLGKSPRSFLVPKAGIEPPWGLSPTEFTVERLLSFNEAIGSRIYEMCKDYIVEVEKRK